MTARERVIEILKENPEGLSKSRLRDRIGGNSGAFRRLVQSMEDRGEIVIETIDDPNCGPTRIHKLAA